MDKLKKCFTGCILQLLLIPVMGQDSSHAGKLSVTGYTELYYQHDFNNPPDRKRPGYIYNHHRNEEINLNLGYLKLSYEHPIVRSSLAIGAGSYMVANYAAETGLAKNIFEATAGLRLSRKINLWMDGGIMPSHIGFESAIGKDCPTLTRSLLAENSPYFETGAKLTYINRDNKWTISGLLLNGWQRIKRQTGNSSLSWGTQIRYSPSEKLVLNYSTFFGADGPDSIRVRRSFHNLYGLIGLSGKWNLSLGFDLGIQEKSKTDPGHFLWYTPVGIIKYNMDSRWSMAARAEYYSDRQSILIAPVNNTGFRAGGFSLNLDYSLTNNIQIRAEGKTYLGKEAVFQRRNEYSRNNPGFIIVVNAGF